MRSPLAEDLKRRQRERFAAMAPEARAAMAERLGEEWIVDYMASHHVDRRAAVSELRRSRRAGRKASASMDGRQ